MRATEQHIRALLRIVAAVLFVWAMPAHALIPPLTNAYYVDQHTFLGLTSPRTGYHSTNVDACSEWMDIAQGTWSGYPTRDGVVGGGNYGTCRISTVGGSSVYKVISRASSVCPANSTAVSGGCQCNAGYAEQGGQCVASQCNSTIGKTIEITSTTGWTRTPNDNDFNWIGGGPEYSFGKTLCEAGCGYEVGYDVVDASISQTPNAQGLYRNSTTYKATGNGAACTLGPEDANNPAAPEPDCPGYVGEVGGVAGCYGTAQKPVDTVSVPRSDGTPRAGNPPSGKVPDQDVGKSPGERTPSTGNGGNAGGPSGAAQGGRGGGAGGASSGTGNTNKPGEGEEQEACGAPGQPECTVKINEKGTPGDPKNKQLEDGVNELKQAQQDALNNAENTAKGWFSGWGFGFSLPSGCTPLDMDGYEFSVNFCRWQSVIHDIMSIVWLMVTAWACIGMVGRTVRGGS
ncbi:hypothetical protein [Xenophilus azovorans]|uniref:hypothetical protein n=1 Tax=Xenophilus azovorans TaxID=151755 RepID=UPI0012EE989E|nr:hypothetical protein [Xenophilus azovorans]